MISETYRRILIKILKKKQSWGDGPLGKGNCHANMKHESETPRYIKPRQTLTVSVITVLFKELGLCDRSARQPGICNIAEGGSKVILPQPRRKKHTFI